MGSKHCSTGRACWSGRAAVDGMAPISSAPPRQPAEEMAAGVRVAARRATLTGSVRMRRARQWSDRYLLVRDKAAVPPRR
jgi:hypothetical protein